MPFYIHVLCKPPKFPIELHMLSQNSLSFFFALCSFDKKMGAPNDYQTSNLQLTKERSWLITLYTSCSPVSPSDSEIHYVAPGGLLCQIMFLHPTSSPQKRLFLYLFYLMSLLHDYCYTLKWDIDQVFTSSWLNVCMVSFTCSTQKLCQAQ